MGPIVIVGAGITGCVIASELARNGHKVVLIEKEAMIGGLAKTFRYGDFSFDVGPHRFFTQKPQICNFIKGILEDDYSVLFRHSEVYFLKKYYTWPLRPTIFFDLPLTITLKSGLDLFLTSIRNGRKKEAYTFEEYILMNYGPSLYSAFFKDYTQKFLGYLPQELHYEWAKEGMKKTIIDERIASRNLIDILKLLFFFKPLQTEFIYPKEGIGIFCERLLEKIKAYKAETWINNFITEAEYSDTKIERIFLKGRDIKPEIIIWTGPLDEICKLLKLPSEGLEYLDLLLFNIEMHRPIKRNYQWCYYGSKDVIFSRITLPNLFSQDMSPETRSGLCVEVACRKDDPRGSNPKNLIEAIKNDLLKVGLVDQLKDLGNIHIERVTNAYPIYTLNYPQALREVKENLRKFKNLILAGRNGLFWYNNMDDSIENGLKIAEDILKATP